MDWKNRVDRIQNKIKYQLHASKNDDLEKIQEIMQVHRPNTSNPLGMRFKRHRRAG